ncbi:MAG: fasciclin domain-containing protein [Phycisphaerae bacterium]
MKNFTKIALSAVAVAALGTGSFVMADHHEKKDKKGGYGEKQDIVATAVSAGQFNTLAAALTQAGLVETLQTGGPFTVFAPTDEAFAKLPTGTVETLLKDENKEQLKSVLLYHVVDGKVKAEKVVGMDTAKTLQGGDVSISTRDGNVFLNDNVQVIKADVMASNGVIHVIDGVLLPQG